MQGTAFEIMRIDQIHAIVSPTVESLLQPLGFEVQGPLSWLRSADAPIRQVFRLAQWKGGALAPSWGVSLDFVPHLCGNDFKWHRTAKSARPDLTFDVRDRAFDISYHYGPETIEKCAPISSGPPFQRLNRSGTQRVRSPTCLALSSGSGSICRPAGWVSTTTRSIRLRMPLYWP